MSRPHENAIANIQSQFDRLVQVNHTGAGSIVYDSGDAHLRARIDSVDRLACEVESVFVSSPTLSRMSSSNLHALAEALSQRIGYLEERLLVLECDHDQAQLRSDRPRQESDQARTYYELLIDTQAVVLKRYRKEHDHPRQAIPAVMTRETCVRVCIDLLDAIAGGA